LGTDVDAQENALPLNTGLSPGLFLQLPAPDGIDVQARLRARLFDADVREAMKLPIPTGTAAIGTKVDHLASLAYAIQNGLTLLADEAARMFDEIVAWDLQAIGRQDQFASAIVKNFNDGTRFAAGHLLTTGVVPALRAEQRTEQRARKLMTFITRTRSWTALGALPYFLPSVEGATDDIISITRRGLIGLETQHVGGAAQAISGWAKLVRNGILPELPRSLVEQLIAPSKHAARLGLSAMLDAARKLLKDNFLLDQDLKRLMQTMSVIRSEFRYEDVDFDTMRAVAISLIRAECAKLAVALKGREADDGTLQGWIDEAKSDPLPEVRFAFIEV
jgi:hypothetical protein